MRFDFEYNELVVIETAAAVGATQEALTSHSVPFAMSVDLRKAGLAWPPQPTDGA